MNWSKNSAGVKGNLIYNCSYYLVMQTDQISISIPTLIFKDFLPLSPPSKTQGKTQPKPNGNVAQDLDLD